MLSMALTSLIGANDSLPLFPPVPSTGTPSGRLRRHRSRPPIELALHASPLLLRSRTAKRGAEYFLLPARSILNRCDSERVPFTWTVNPYRGCEFGCKYCYARYTHEYMELDGGEFERKIFVKQDAGPLAARELRSSAVRGEHIAIGTATDPYQPAEREFGATRAILEEMAQLEGLSVSITTKSDQVLRDMDLLKRIHERSQTKRQSVGDDAAAAVWRDCSSRERHAPICASGRYELYGRRDMPRGDSGDARAARADGSSVRIWRFWRERPAMQEPAGLPPVCFF